MPVFEFESQLPCSLDGLFDFLSQPTNIVRITRSDIGMKFTSAPDVLAVGSKLDFQIITFGQVVKASHLITALDRPRLIVEKQVAGPMKSWVHYHEFEPLPNGDSLKRERIEFELPGGLLGLLLSEAKIKDHLEDGLSYSEQKLMQLIEQGVIA